MIELWRNKCAKDAGILGDFGRSGNEERYQARLRALGRGTNRLKCLAGKEVVGRGGFDLRCLAG